MAKLTGALRDYANAPKKYKKTEVIAFLKARQIFPCVKENAMRRGWRKNTAGR
jgi:hypothetical protein